MQAPCQDQFKKYVLTSYDKYYLIIWYEKLISRLPFLGVISLRVLELVNNADNMSSKRKKMKINLESMHDMKNWYQDCLFLGENSHMNFSFPF